ncbi:DUF4118 domain-containing protein [Methylophilus aquaticus]|uniref:histidine kinase n=1 Tax=Methylophilus aquaticus TaxID=1971610 RepID=A0ABT9JU32_9PROT|nr:DUF4118 domain-containing protein [Methylophilus aquaticus]MDP8568058.1 DUF4118 domain-containing protein [Methylophilus aquaticus]
MKIASEFAQEDSRHRIVLVMTSLVGLLSIITWLGLSLFATLGLTAMALLYLLCVLWVAYIARFPLALGTAILAFLLINFCFIEPRYTFRIASMQSWLMLLVFVVVALTVSSAMQQLKLQTRQAQLAARQSRFFQSLAELFATQSHPHALLEAGCQHVHAVFDLRVAVVRRSLADGPLEVIAGDAALAASLPPSSVQWAIDFNRAMGAGTADWPALSCCLIPFGFQQTEVLVVAQPHKPLDIDFLRLLAHQCSQAYVKLGQHQALLQSELRISEATFKKTLLTALSHDMRTPLTAIVGAVNVLADQNIALDATQSRQLLESIRAESDYLVQATENILTLVKLEAGPATVHPDWQLAEEVVEHVVQRYRQRPQALPLAVHVFDVGVLVKLDAMLVAHALANLIDNAVVWHQGTQPVTITLRRQAPWLVLSVSNEGPGFPADFEIAAFVQRKERPAGARGYGLGLLIVKTVMELHHGQLQIQSVPGQTTQVSMLFPLSPVPEIAAR